MRVDIQIPGVNGVNYHFCLNFSYGSYKRIEVDNVCVINIFKFHNHRYDIQCFFYKTKNICFRNRIGSLKELYDVIQNLLQENL